MPRGVGTGVDLGARSLKIVQGRLHGETFQLLRAVKVDLDPADERPYAERIAEAIAGSGLAAKGALLGVTGKDLVLRYTQVPPVTPYRLKTLMDFEVREILSGGGGDVAAGYGVLPFSGPGDENLVLLALAKNQFLGERIGALEGAGVGVAGACPNTVALFNSFLKNGEFKAEETTLLLGVGAENTDLAIQRNADLLFARNLAFGGSHFTRALAETLRTGMEQAERVKIARAAVATPGIRGRGGEEERIARSLAPAAGQLFSAIQSSVLFCRNQTKLFDLAVGRVLLAGGGGRLRGLGEYLSASLGVPVEVFDPMGAVDLSRLPPAEAEAAGSAGPEFATALGLAQMAVDRRFFRILLLPDALRRRRELRSRALPMAAAGFFLAAFLAVHFLAERKGYEAAEKRYQDVSRIQTDVERRSKAHATLTGETRARLEKLNLLARRAGTGPAALRALALMDRWLPPELWLTHIESREVDLSDAPAEGGERRGTRPGASRGEGDGPRDPPFPGVALKGAGKVRDRPLSEPFNEMVLGLQAEPGVRVLAHPFTQKKDAAEFELILAFGAPPAPAAAGKAPEEGGRKR